MGVMQPDLLNVFGGRHANLFSENIIESRAGAKTDIMGDGFDGIMSKIRVGNFFPGSSNPVLIHKIEKILFQLLI